MSERPSSDSAPLSRHQVVDTLKKALESLSYTHALWLGGAAAFDRVDSWSDIDMQMVVDDDRVDDTVQVIEDTLQGLAPLETRYHVPEPTWHGHRQAFYRLEGSNPFLIVDLVVMKLSADNRFLQPEIHGNPVVLFDKSGIVASTPLDTEALEARIMQRRATLRTTFPLFRTLILKELNRGNFIEAVSFYHGFTLRPLVELLRMKHSPARYTFHTRYVYYDLPKETVKELEDLFAVRDSADLAAKQERASRLVTALLDQQ